MNRSFKRIQLVTGVLGAFALVTASPAAAATVGAAVVVGSGTISPGLTLVPTPQTVSFNGTAVGAVVSTNGSANVLAANCDFDGGSGTYAETELRGRGNVTGNCANQAPAPAQTLNCAIPYVRIAAVVVIDGTCTAGGTVSGTGFIDGAFIFQPTSAQPTRNYQLQGVAIVQDITNPTPSPASLARTIQDLLP